MVLPWVPASRNHGLYPQQMDVTRLVQCLPLVAVILQAHTANLVRCHQQVAVTLQAPTANLVRCHQQVAVTPQAHMASNAPCPQSALVVGQTVTLPMQDLPDQCPLAPMAAVLSAQSLLLKAGAGPIPQVKLWHGVHHLQAQAP